MNTHTAAATAPLTLTQRFDGPWLAIRRVSVADIHSIVLAGDPRAPDIWRRIDADQPVETGRVAEAQLTPLADFGVFCSLYPHSRVLSAWRATISRAHRPGLPSGHGAHWPWEGKRCDRIKIERSMWDLVAAAAKDCNTIGRVRA